MSHEYNYITQLINVYKLTLIKIQRTQEELTGVLLRHCPNEFDLGHYNLSFLFCLAGIGIDNYLLECMEDEEYKAVIRTGKILYQYAYSTKQGIKDLLMNTANPSEDVFLFKFFEGIGQELKTLEDVADSTLKLGLDLIKMREISREKQKELRSLCLLLSERASGYWHSQHPHGFEQYSAA